MFFPFKALFWVVLISFVITGGDYERAARAEGRFAPIQHTAGLVVHGVDMLRTLCDDHERFCEETREAFADAGGYAGERAGGAWTWTRKTLERWLDKD
ncbi:MAG: hypothetical protein U1E87_05730 [Alphaproteobacteria bacterium]